MQGRLPVHHGGMLSDYHTDDIDLRWSTIAEKLKPAGYRSFWHGKGHTGYKSVAHLPINLGFEGGHVGFLIGQQSYTSTDRWKDAQPYHNGTYSTTLYGA